MPQYNCEICLRQLSFFSCQNLWIPARNEKPAFVYCSLKSRSHCWGKPPVTCVRMGRLATVAMVEMVSWWMGRWRVQRGIAVDTSHSVTSRWVFDVTAVEWWRCVCLNAVGTALRRSWIPSDLFLLSVMTLSKWFPLSRCQAAATMEIDWCVCASVSLLLESLLIVLSSSQGPYTTCFILTRTTLYV